MPSSEADSELRAYFHYLLPDEDFDARATARVRELLLAGMLAEVPKHFVLRADASGEEFWMDSRTGLTQRGHPCD